jgi:hypothetical protein
MRLRQARDKVAILAVLGLALWAGPAAAQEAQPAARAAWQSVDVTLLDSAEVADPLMIVSARLPVGTQLPAEIAVPIPADGQIQWAGEILGGDVSQDPQAQPRIESGEGYDLAVYTLRRARAAQVEVVATGAASTSGTQRTARLAWASPVAVPQVTVAIRVAAGSKVPKAPAGSSRRADGRDGTVQYVRTYKAVKAGQRLTMELVYRPAAPSPGTGQGEVPEAPGGAPGAPAAQGAGAAAWAPLLLALAIAAAVYLWMSGRRSAGRRRAEAEMDEEDVEEAGDLEEESPRPAAKPKPKPRAKPRAKRAPAPPADETPEG